MTFQDLLNNAITTIKDNPGYDPYLIAVESAESDLAYNKTIMDVANDAMRYHGLDICEELDKIKQKLILKVEEAAVDTYKT